MQQPAAAFLVLVLVLVILVIVLVLVIVIVLVLASRLNNRQEHEIKTAGLGRATCVHMRLSSRQSMIW